jgi:DMSO/TMAO reductase YedYZ molybdopterin-dependent catalytic subunit
MKLKFLLISTFLTILLINITPATAATGTLEITDLSNVKYNFTYQQLAEMPKTTQYAELYCYGNLVGAGDWSGVQLSYLLNQISDGSNVNSIQFVAADSYTVAIPTLIAIAPETIIAYQKNGDPLPEGLRLVLPGYNGASWIAQIMSITMSSNEAPTPPAASGSGGRANLLENIIENRQILPKPSLTPQQIQPTPQPTPNNSTPNPTAPKANTTQVEPTPKQQTTANQSIMIESETIVIIATIIMIILAIAGAIMFKGRSKLKEGTPHNS